MSKIYIFGHKNPDTDAVMSAIGLSYLKNKLGEDTEPRVLGTVNKETKYALDYFHIKEPEYLNDVKLQIKDINYHKNLYIEEVDSIYNGYQKLLSEDLTGLPVIDKYGQCSGLIAMKDLSRGVTADNFDDLYTSFDNLLHTLKAREEVKIDEEIRGKIITATYHNSEFIESEILNENTILIVDNRYNTIERAIQRHVKMIILSNNTPLITNLYDLAISNKVNIISTPLDSYNISRLIGLSNYIKTMNNCYEPVKFESSEFVDNVIDINNRLKHTNYPIVDKKNSCLGLLKITDLNEKVPKQVILVDHNDKLQSVEGIEEAEILEIIDHHNLGNITTNSPINFRNVAVGSTCTIIYMLYKEKDIEIPKQIAGALLSGILSDTLILKSPTATAKDILAVRDLSSIAGVDYLEYGMNLLKAATSLKGMSKYDVLYNDFKVYTINDKHFAIGQFFTTDFEEIKRDLGEYIKVLDEVSQANNYNLVALYVTDIIKNGSYIIFNNRGRDIIEIAYNKKNIEQGYFADGCVSRKRHVVPIIMPIYEN